MTIVIRIDRKTDKDDEDRLGRMVRARWARYYATPEDRCDHCKRFDIQGCHKCGELE